MMELIIGIILVVILTWWGDGNGSRNADPLKDVPYTNSPEGFKIITVLWILLIIAGIVMVL